MSCHVMIGPGGNNEKLVLSGLSVQAQKKKVRF